MINLGQRVLRPAREWTFVATVTSLFDGSIEHRESIGSRKVIEPGAINLMTAGKGIVHSERSPAAARAAGPSFYGMQTWLALPDGREEVDPAFEHVPRDRLPVVEGGGASARVVMGSLWGSASPVTCHSETIYADIALEALEWSIRFEGEVHELARFRSDIEPLDEERVDVIVMQNPDGVMIDR